MHCQLPCLLPHLCFFFLKIGDSPRNGWSCGRQSTSILKHKQCLIWDISGFPKIGLPASGHHPFLDGIFHYKPTISIGTPIGNLHLGSHVQLRDWRLFVVVSSSRSAGPSQCRFNILFLACWLKRQDFTNVKNLLENLYSLLMWVFLEDFGNGFLNNCDIWWYTRL